MPEISLIEFLQTIKDAEEKMGNGDASAFLACWATDEPISVIGANGIIDRNEKVLEGPPRVAAMSKGVRNCTYTDESVTQVGDLAFVYWMSESENLMNGREEYMPLKMTVTHIVLMGMSISELKNIKNMANYLLNR